MDCTVDNGTHSRPSSEVDAENSGIRGKSFNLLVKKDRSFSQVDTRNNKGCVPLYFERASSGWWFPKFDSAILEKEYQEFSFVNNRRAVVKILIYLLIAVLIWMIYFGATQKGENRQPVLIAIACFGGVFFALLAFVKSHLYSHVPCIASLFLALLIIAIDLLFFLRSAEELSGSARFAMCASFILIIYTTLHSIPLFVCMIILVLFSIIHEVLYNVSLIQNDDASKIVCTAFLHLVIHLIAIQISFMAQVRDRSTFWKFGQRLIAKREAEIEKSATDSMIRSVIPESIIEELLLVDFQKKKVSFRPFKMHRMENVSILFADIVGFTQMSSNKTAEQLVGLLSDLFGRFDQLTYENQCEKISTLGDAYYCVAGCPEAIPEHAFCCVDMGLAMVKTIKEFDEENNEQVGMRVGIHTGTVLCGIIGNKRFKFDVWSNDVTLANKMETAGVPGKVHITQATYDFLDDSYIYEPGNGGSRHAALEDITTYLITGKKKKHEKKSSSRNHSHHKKCGSNEASLKKVSIRVDKNSVQSSSTPSSMLSVQTQGDTKSPKSSLKIKSEEVLESDILNSSVTSEEDHVMYNGRRPSQHGGTINEAIARARLRTSNDMELVNLIKDNENSFADPPLVTGSLWFKDRNLEKSYHEKGQDTTMLSPTVTTFASPKVNFLLDVFISNIVYVLVVVLCFVMLNSYNIHVATYVIFGVTVVLEIFFLVYNVRRAFPQYLGIFKVFSKVPGWLSSHISGTVLMCLPVLTILMNFTVCDELTDDDNNKDDKGFVTFSADVMIVAFIHFCNFTQLISILKSGLVAIFAVLFIVITTAVPKCNAVAGIVERDMIPATILLVILIFILNHRNDIGVRMNFLVDAEAARDKKQAKMNKAQADWLLESIIPKHVINELEEEKLYSRNYENVGVIFASIVNFGDFYEENFEGGKECIRVLNELVGDFDDLLGKPGFSEVEKIKTVNGSTFMAASGLNSQGNGTGKNHLKQLIEFALAMLQEISNFNDNMLGFKFILRVGFNAGPVTAGVIGSNKLFYDIWGDTVNIASRMDTTGVGGRVQVSEASKNLLEEFFSFEDRGEIQVKGKGKITTFLLVDPNTCKPLEVSICLNYDTANGMFGL